MKTSRRAALDMAVLAMPLAVVAAAALAQPAAARQTAAPVGADSSQIEAEAMRAVEASRAYLRTLTSAELRAEMTIDGVDDGDLALEFLNRARYVWRAPDKLFISWSTDRAARRLYFDGQTATLLAPRTGYYAQVRRPGTVANLLIHAATEYGIIFPLPDLLLWVTSRDEPLDIRRAFKVGYARIAGVDTDQYAFRQPDADWQVWIERGARPLPRKIVITTRDDPARPRLSALLQWSVNPQVPDAVFAFSPPAGSASIGLISLTSAGDAK